jgi:hypothetical protein
LVLADDLVIAAGAAVTTATLIILTMTLVRYRAAVSDANRSAQLAKNLWDSMNARLSVQDARIIDLMAKVEVYSVRKSPSPSKAPIQAETPTSSTRITMVPQVPEYKPSPDQGAQETGTQILTALASGPKSSREIKQIIAKSREHTARLMKILYDQGMVVRNDQNKPYVYEITEAGRRYLSGT